MRCRAWRFALSVVVVAFAVAGCAGPNPLAHSPGGHGVAGFWTGLLHGVILFFTFVISLFNKDVHIYEVHNNGAWYNFGFLLGAMISLGGGGRSIRQSKS